jgi:hypothetical protein
MTNAYNRLKVISSLYAFPEDERIVVLFNGAVSVQLYVNCDWLTILCCTLCTDRVFCRRDYVSKMRKETACTKLLGSGGRGGKNGS